MGRKRRNLIAALLVALFATLAWAIFHPREPMYQGKPLSYWLEGYGAQLYDFHLTDGGVVTRAQTDQAIRAIGTNAIPTALRLLQVNDPPWKIGVINLLQKQHLIKIKQPEATKLNYEAVVPFSILQANAVGAVPALVVIFDRNISSSSRMCAVMCFGEIGPPASNAVPTLIKGLTNADSGLRAFLVTALGKIHSQPDLAVPALTNCLGDLDRDVREMTVDALSAFGADARPAVPALVAMLNDPSSVVSMTARAALQRIDPEAAAKAGVK